MKIVCWQTILMKYHTLFFRKLRNISQNLSSAAVVIGALKVKSAYQKIIFLFLNQNIFCVYSKNRLNETVLLSTHNMLKLMGKKIVTILRSKILFV